MSNQTSDAELDQNGNLMHYRAMLIESDFEAMTKEDLWENYKSLIETNNKIAVQYENAKYREDLYAKTNAQLKGDLEKWKHAARSLLFAASKAVTWIETVHTNISHYKGFIHHMRSIVDQLNQNELDSATSELATPIANARELLKKDGDWSDIPF